MVKRERGEQWGVGVGINRGGRDRVMRYQGLMRDREM